MDVNENKPCEGSKIDGEEIVHSGRFLDTKLIYYTDPLGRKKTWEACSYKGSSKYTGANCVEVIAVLKRNLHHNCFVLVRQFRPPLGCYAIEFPAGMCDPDDADVRACALRELREETGFVGKVLEGKHIETPTSLDPSSSTALSVSVHVIIDGDDHQNIDCVQHLDDEEFIKVLIVPVRELLQRLNKLASDKNVISSTLYNFALGLEMGQNMGLLR